LAEGNETAWTAGHRRYSARLTGTPCRPHGSGRL